MNDRIAQMAVNNAAWIDMAVSALGLQGEFGPILWQCHEDMPPVFPNADTLGGTDSEKLAAIAELVEARAGKVVAVKDAWAQLDLAPLGFKVLFSADWLYRPAEPLALPNDELEIVPITTPEELIAFALACNGPEIPYTVYSPKLLNRPDIAWLAGVYAGGIVAGVTAVNAKGLNGINNLFGETAAQKQQLLVAAVNAFPELPACGYEGRDAIPPYLSLGFETAGNLRVWLRVPQES